VPESVHAARRFTTETLAKADGRTLEAVELMVSELATNCIRHEHASFHIAILSAPNEIRVEVTDGGSGAPRMRSPGPDEPSGRGLQIVNMLSDRWGVEPESPAGKTVWFTLDVAPDPDRGSGSAAAGHGRGSGTHTTGHGRGSGTQLTAQGRGSKTQAGSPGNGSASAAGGGHRPTVQRGRAPQASKRARRCCAHEPGRHARRRCHSRDAAG
ncbi:MAG: ATP-binding protein, partial [Trebonia sp.]